MKTRARTARSAALVFIILGPTLHCGSTAGDLVPDGGSDGTVGDAMSSPDGDAQGSAPDGGSDATVSDAMPVSNVDAQGSAPEAGFDATAGDAMLFSDGNGQDGAGADAGVGLADTGAGGDAPADAGTPGDALADAADGSVFACGQVLPVGQTSFDDIVRTCALAVSCDPFVFTANLGFCISLDWLHSRPAYACLTTIRDCNGYFQCTGERSPTPADCPSTAPAARCDTANNVAIDCNSSVVTSCARLGGTCGVYTDATGTRHARCVVVPSCTEADGGAGHCSGSNFYTCLGGVGFGQDCALESEACSTTDAGSACTVVGPPCSRPGCDGGVMTVCSSPSNRTLTYDCAAAGLACTSDDAGFTNCLAPGCTSPFDACPAVESCGTDGKTLTVCVGGAPLAIDCTKLGAGFTSCSTFSDSTGFVYGYCR